MSTNALPISPRLLALSEKLALDNSAALTAFWSDVLAQGTPLLEPLPDDASELLVTFLWRAHDPATQAAVIGDLTQRRPELLTQLPNTDIWYRSYRLRADLRTTYELMVNDDWQIDPFNPQQFHVPRDEATNKRCVQQPEHVQALNPLTVFPIRRYSCYYAHLPSLWFN